MNVTLKNTKRQTEVFDLFGNENEIGNLETELINKRDFKERKDMPHNEYLFQKVRKEMKPIKIQDSVII
jgi:hypothetical protein